LVLAALVAAIFFAAVSLGNGQKTVRVPNVVGKTESDATQEIAAKGLVPITKYQQSNAKTNTVIAQDPERDANVKRKAKVTITVSAGVGEGTVPNVTGRTVADATKALEKAHFGVKVDPKQPSSTVDPDLVISTNPPIGTTETFGTTIHLIPSSGVTVPNVVGLSATDAATQLTAAGVSVRPQREASDTYAFGTVTRTDPPAGTSNLKGGSFVDMFVSTGAATVPVPSVVGLTSDAAMSVLHAAKLQGSILLEPTPLKGNDGKVLSQSPSAGDPAKPQSTVVLNVGQFTPPETTSSLPTSTTTTKPTGP
jgi:eukaryotic-like serine/threonine-protein kinase